MRSSRVFAAWGAAALLAGTCSWLASRPKEHSTSPGIAPAALLAATFTDSAGRPQALGQFQGKVIVLNFWATWCAPCREEMPAFARLQSKWGSRNVQFVGLSSEEPRRIADFARTMDVNYPLWSGGDEIGELARRLGNQIGVLPYSTVLSPEGKVLSTRVGPYSEPELDAVLTAISPK